MARPKYPVGSPGLSATISESRRGARVVELACLENKCARKGTKGSNPFLSANIKGVLKGSFYIADKEHSNLCREAEGSVDTPHAQLFAASMWSSRAIIPSSPPIKSQ
ncbi:MAG: hypothetical protein JWP13_764 [Candidatus Saccharibacteria bacterium]|nr:hypothetical protein [Candidatus Saccharibacteria bacterium]